MCNSKWQPTLVGQFNVLPIEIPPWEGGHQPPLFVGAVPPLSW